MAEIMRLVAKYVLDDKQYRDSLKAAPGAARQAGDAIAREGSRGLDQLQQRLTTIGQNIGNVGKTLSVNLTAPLAAVATAAIASARALGNYADNLLDTSARTGLTTDRLQEFANVARAAGVNASALGDAAEMLTRRMTSGEEDTARLTRALEFLGVELRVSKDDAQATADRVDVLAQAAIDAGADAGVLEDAIRAAGGVTVDFGRIALDAGADADALRDRLESLGVETRDAGDAFDVLGDVTLSSAGDLRSLDDVMPEILTSLADMEDKTLRNVLANEIFGRAASELIPVLELGSDEIERLAEEARAMGQVLSLDTLNAANNFRIAQAQLTAEFSIASREITVALLPILLEFTNFVRQTVIPVVRDVAQTIVGWIERFRELTPEQQRLIVGIGAFVAAIGPAVAAIGGFITIAGRFVGALNTIRTALIAVRSAALLAAGPAGWAVLAGTAIAGLVTWFVRKKRAADDGAEALDGVSSAARLNADALGQARDAADRLAERAERLVGPVRDVRQAVLDSSGSVADLRAKVQEIAGTLDGEASASFVAFAEQAIATGGDLKTVGERIADRAARDSLISRVNLLAEDIDENGRQAFKNYALEAIATADTQEEAMERVMRAWAAAQTQTERNALAIARSAITAQIATAQAELDSVYRERNILLRDIQANLDRVTELQAANTEGVIDHSGTIRALNAETDLYRSLLVQTDGEVLVMRNGIRDLNTELQRNEMGTAALDDAYVNFTRTTQTLTESGAKPLAAAQASVATATRDTTVASEEARDEAQEALAAAAAAAAAADAAISEINRANAAASAGIAASIEETITATNAAANALAAQGAAAVAYVATTLSGLDAIIKSIGVFEFDSAALARSIEEAMSDTSRISVNLTRQAELLTQDIFGGLIETGRQIDAAVQESDRMRAGIIESVEAYSARVGDETQAAANATVANINAQTNAILAFLDSTIDQTNDLIDEIVAGNEKIRAGIEATNREAADATFPNYAALAETTLEAAAATFLLTQRKANLGLVTETELVASIESYLSAIEAEMTFVGMQNDQYVDLAEKLQEILVLKAAISGGPKLDAGGGDARTISGSITQVLNDLADRFKGLTGAALTLAANFSGFADLILSNIPLIGSAFEAFTVEIDTATGAVSLSFDLFTFLAGILEVVISRSEAFRDAINAAWEQLQPFIEIIGTAIAVAITPLIDAAVALFGAITPLIEVVINVMALAFKPLGDFIKDVIVPILKDLAPALTAVFTALTPLFRIVGSLVQAFGTLITGALKPVIWVVEKVLAPVLTAVARVVTGIWNALATVVNAAVAIVTLGAVRNLIPLIGREAEQRPPPFTLPGEPVPGEPTTGLPVAPAPPAAPPSDTPIGGGPVDPAVPYPVPVPPGDGGGGGSGDGGTGGGGGGTTPRPGIPKPPPRFPTPPRTPTPPTPTPTPPTPTPPRPDRPTVFPDSSPVNFAAVSQSVQFAVATPLVEASLRMLEAARLFSGVGAGPTGLFDAVPPFTAVLERLTPILDRLIVEGVDIKVESPTQQSPFTNFQLNALRPL